MMSRIVSFADAYCNRTVDTGTRCLEMLVEVANDRQEFQKTIKKLRGKSIALKWPVDHTLEICAAEDTILTQMDIEARKNLSFMGGDVLILGTMGHGKVFSWDRPVGGLSANGTLFTYHVGKNNYVIKASDSLEHLLHFGVEAEYFDAIRLIKTDKILPPKKKTTWRGCDPYQIEDTGGVMDCAGNYPRVTIVECAVKREPGTVRGDITDELFTAAKKEMLLL